MKKQFFTGYIISLLFVAWAALAGNYEFIAYAAATAVLLGAIHYSDRFFSFNEWALWGFDFWMLLHIFGGLFVLNGKVLYNFVVLSVVREPYSILKYDQVVHVYCYFIIAILMWSVVKKVSDKRASFGMLAFLTVMAASGIGGLNEIVEFATTLFFDTNVGGYENTAIDIIANLAGSLMAVPLFRKL